MTNIYWPVYKNLESEVIKLSYVIHMDDNQINVYSSKIIDLILRAATEIESISKELYKNSGGPKTKNIKYDYDAINYLNKKWLLDKKVIIISYFNCFQSDKELLPFIKNETKTLKNTEKIFSWNNAYQNLKHDRSNSLEYGSIKYLFDIMGALFILNLYYKSEVYDLKNDASATNLPVSMGSDLFSIKIHISSSHTVQDNKLEYLKKSDFDRCVYFTKLKDDSVKIEEDAIKRTNEENMKLLVQHPKFIEYVKHNDISKYTGHNIMWDILGKDDYIKLVRETMSIITEANRSLSYEAVVNKNNI